MQMFLFGMLNLLHWLTAGSLFFMAFYSLYHGKSKSLARALFSFLFLAGLWAFLAAWIYSTPHFETKILLNRLKMGIVSFLPLSIFYLGIALHGTMKVKRVFWFFILIIPTVSVVLLTHPSLHLSFIKDYRIIFFHGYELFAFSNGPWFIAHSLQAWILTLFSIFMILRSTTALHRYHRVKTLLLAMGMIIPLCGDSLAVFLFQELRFVQITPALMSFSGLFFMYAIFKHHALDVIPYARSLVIENIPDPYLVLDSDDVLIDFNNASRNIFKLKDDEIGKKLNHTLLFRSEFAPLFEEWKEKKSIEEITFLNNSGVQKFFEVHKYQLASEGDHLEYGILLFFRDITNQKAIDNELKALSELKSKFLGIVAHDLVGNVRSLSLISESLMKENHKLTSDEIQSISELIHYSSTSINDFIERLLLWSRSQLNNYKVKIERVDVQLLVADVLDFLRPVAAEKDIDLHLDIEKNLTMNADKDMIQAILRNLVSNAIKFSADEGRVEISVKAKNEGFLFSIQDHGRGMTEDESSQLFHFIQKDGDDSKKTGLGLLIVKEFIDLHQGKIWVESQIHQGSTFYFHLP